MGIEPLRSLGLAALSTGALLIAPALIFLLSRIGWKPLADAYPCGEKPPRPRKWMGCGVFNGWIGYNGGLVVAADERGIYLSSWPILLSWCHAPIFLPWGELEIRRAKRWHGWVYELHARKAPAIDFALRPATFEFIRDAALRAGAAGDYR